MIITLFRHFIVVLLAQEPDPLLGSRFRRLLRRLSFLCLCGLSRLGFRFGDLYFLHRRSRLHTLGSLEAHEQVTKNLLSQSETALQLGHTLRIQL
jgi:hypothetical protein